MYFAEPRDARGADLEAQGRDRFAGLATQDASADGGAAAAVDADTKANTALNASRSSLTKTEHQTSQADINLNESNRVLDDKALDESQVVDWTLHLGKKGARINLSAVPLSTVTATSRAERERVNRAKGEAARRKIQEMRRRENMER